MIMYRETGNANEQIRTKKWSIFSAAAGCRGKRKRTELQNPRL